MLHQSGLFKVMSVRLLPQF